MKLLKDVIAALIVIAVVGVGYVEVQGARAETFLKAQCERGNVEACKSVAAL